MLPESRKRQQARPYLQKIGFRKNPERSREDTSGPGRAHRGRGRNGHPSERSPLPRPGESGL